METLIEKIRKLNSIFTQSSVTFMPLNALCQQLCNIIECNIYVFDENAYIFAYSVAEAFSCAYTERSLENRVLPGYYMEQFLEKENGVQAMYEPHPQCTFSHVEECQFRDRYYSLYPIYFNFRKVAGMLMIRYGENFSESDNILCEYTRAIISLEMIRQAQDNLQQQSLEIAAAQLAVNFLTFSERKAVKAVLKQLPQDDGTIFLNVVAAQSYSSQSTVTSALKKLEGAGTITTKTQGVKGKYVKITNPHLRDMIANADKNSISHSSRNQKP